MYRGEYVVWPIQVGGGVVQICMTTSVSIDLTLEIRKCHDTGGR